MLAGPYVFGATPGPGGRNYRLHRRCPKSGCRRFRIAARPGRSADHGDRARRTGHCPFPASGLVTRAAWLVPAQDGTGTHEPGPGPGEAVPDRALVRHGQRVTCRPSMSSCAVTPCGPIMSRSRCCTITTKRRTPPRTRSWPLHGPPGPDEPHGRDRRRPGGDSGAGRRPVSPRGGADADAPGRAAIRDHLALPGWPVLRPDRGPDPHHHPRRPQPPVPRPPPAGRRPPGRRWRGGCVGGGTPVTPGPLSAGDGVLLVRR